MRPFTSRTTTSEDREMLGLISGAVGLVSSTVNLAQTLFRLVISCVLPISAFAIHSVTGIPFLWCFAVVWLAASVLRHILGYMWGFDLTFYTRMSIAWQAGLSAIALFFSSTEDTLACSVVLLLLNYYVVERYDVSQLAAMAKVKRLKSWTGRKHELAVGDGKGTGKPFLTRKEVLAIKALNAPEDPRKYRIPLGVAVDYEDIDDAKKIIGTTREITLPDGSKKEYSNFDGLVSTGKMIWVCPLKKFHLLDISGIGGMKSVSRAIIAAAEWGGSCSFNDTKAEIYWATADDREARGHRVVRLSDMDDGPDPRKASFDILGAARIRIGPRLISDLDVTAASCVVRRPSMENFFTPAAREVFSGAAGDLYLTHKLTPGSRRPVFRDVAKQLMYETATELQANIKEIIERNRQRSTDTTLTRADRRIAEDIVAKLAQHADKDDQESWKRVVLTFNEAMGWAKNSELLDMVSGVGDNVFDLEDIFTGKLSIYININPTTMRSTPDICSAIHGAIGDTIMLNGINRMCAVGGFYMQMDEMPTLNSLSVVHGEGGLLEVGRGYGVILHGFIQSIEGFEQAAGKGMFSKWAQSVDFLSFYGVGDNAVANYFEEQLGTLGIATDNASGGGRGSLQQNSGSDERKVLAATKILQCPSYIGFIRVKGGAPIAYAKSAFFWRREWAHFEEKLAAHANVEIVEATEEDTVEYKRMVMEQMVQNWFQPADRDVDALERKLVDWLSGLGNTPSHAGWFPQDSVHEMPERDPRPFVTMQELVSRLAPPQLATKLHPERMDDAKVDELWSIIATVAAEIAWGFIERWWQWYADQEAGVEHAPRDFAANLRQSAPTLYAMLLAAAVEGEGSLSEGGELLLAMEETAGHPRGLVGCPEPGDDDVQGVDVVEGETVSFGDDEEGGRDGEEGYGDDEDDFGGDEQPVQAVAGSDEDFDDLS
jgi:type IV secretory pathway TraG/TraD family ATPase VirD4